MKKKLLPFTATALALLISLSGCSCTGTSPLDKMTDAFNDNNAPTVNYTETLTYKVENVDEYGGKFRKSDVITDNVLKYDMNGEYTMTLKVLDKTDDAVKDIKSDLLLENSNTGTLIYHLKSELKLTTNYKAPYKIYQEDKDTAVEEKSFEESIVTESFFLPSGYSFNPIYSTTEGKTSFIQINGDSMATVIFMEYSTKTVYNKKNYTISEKYGDAEEQTKKHSYKFRTLIDNNTLLFTLRNIDVDTGSEYSLPVVHPTYNSAQKLNVKNLGGLTKNVKLNGSDTEIGVPVKEISFYRNKSNATGSEQYVLIQKEKVGEIANKAMLVQYTSPLTCYGSYICLGGLQYTLQSYKY